MTNFHHWRRRLSLAFLAMSIPIVSDIGAEEPSLEMRLDWPADREALVEAVRTWEVKGAPRQPGSTMRVKYTSHVLEVPDGYEVEIGDVDFTMDLLGQVVAGSDHNGNWGQRLGERRQYGYHNIYLSVPLTPKARPVSCYIRMTSGSAIGPIHGRRKLWLNNRAPLRP